MANENKLVADTVAGVLKALGVAPSDTAVDLENQQDRWEKVRGARPLRKEKEIPCVAPDGCTFVACVQETRLHRHGEKEPVIGWTVKELRQFKNAIENGKADWPEGMVTKEVDGRPSIHAKKHIFETYWRKWLGDLGGKELPATLVAANQEAIKALEVK